MIVAGYKRVNESDIDKEKDLVIVGVAQAFGEMQTMVIGLMVGKEIEVPASLKYNYCQV